MYLLTLLKKSLMVVLCRQPLPSRRWGGCLLGTVCCLLSCSDNTLISNKYSNLPARFNFSPVSAYSQLYSACNSMGEWSSIRAEGTQFIFSNLTGSTPVNRTQVQNYSGFYMGLSGFLVGLPNVPELGSDHSVVTCYDLACSNCYHTNSVTKRLILQAGGKAFCNSCQRTYDLNNMGQVSRGEGGINLFRYRVFYGNNTLSIQNK